VYERHADGSLELLRNAGPASGIFRVVRGRGGFTQINHPTIFPSSDPSLRRFCRGCPWDFTPEATDFGLVDAIEIQTGPAGFGDTPNPFTLTAIEFWEDALSRGHRIAAVGSSDSHNAGRTTSATQTPIGQATTMVYAEELSERGIRDAVQAGHTYVKLFGNAGPDLRFEARSPEGESGIMGDTLYAPAATFTARALGVPTDEGSYTLHVVRNGVVVASVPLEGPELEYEFFADGPARYRLQLQRGELVIALTSPIYLGRGPQPDSSRRIPIQ
jgi:hypothetical protein